MAEDRTQKDQNRQSEKEPLGKSIQNEDRHIVERVERPDSWPPPPEKKKNQN